MKGQCQCDPGWAGAACGRLDLLPQARQATGAVLETRESRNSSWCVTAPRRENDTDGNVAFHIFVSEMVPDCGLLTWIGLIT